MNNGGFTLCVLLSIAVNQVCGISNYVILAPNYIRDKHPYQLSVSTINSDVPSKLQISLQGFSETDVEIKIKTQLQLEANQTQLVELNTTYLESGVYTLRLKSLTNSDLDRQIPLNFYEETFLVLIQTDKPLYKPGNTVKFRILVLDQATKPLGNLKSIRVTISDPDENVIKVWPFAKVRNGVFYSQLDIANEPNPGNWTITASVRGKDQTRAFLVDDYKLPKHEISIRTPNVATANDHELILDIRASYTFGGPMKGDLTVFAYGYRNVSKTLKMNGLGRVRFQIGELLDLNDSVDDTLIPVDVRLLERYTKRIFHASSSVPIHKSPVIIELEKSSEFFVPGYPYSCWLRLTDPFGAKLNIDTSPVAISIVYIGPNQFLKNVEENLTPDSGDVIPLTLQIPKQATEAAIDVLYETYSEQFLLIGNPTGSPVLFKAMLLTRNVTLNEPVSIQVQSSVPLDFVTYQVVSKTRIVEVKKIEANRENTTIFYIIATTAMIPKAKIFVFSVHNNTILSDSLTVEVLHLPNMMNLTLSEQQVAPGQRVKLTIQSTPNSMIGLSAIDKGLLQLAEGNPINKQRIFNELDGNFAEQNSENAQNNIIVVSNMKQNFVLGPRFGHYNADEEDDYIPPRRQFSESWLWNDLNEAGSDGILNIWDNAPDAITSWEISGFSISPEYGLGVLNQPLSLKVSKPFFIILNLPNSIKKSETAVIEVSVFNYLDEMLYVGVKLKNTRQEYEFIHNEGRRDAYYQSKNVVLTPNSATTTRFYIKPKKLGDIVLKVIAESSEASDSVERLLRITPESLPYSKTEPRHIQLDNSSQTFRNMRLEIPRHIDADSEKIRFSVQGNLLGNTIDNLPEQIRLPFGSGEQNALKMVPNLVVLDYIKSTGEYGDAVRNRTVKFLETGYQNQLKFKHGDGSFSMFGKEDTSGSVGLTALVAKTLQQTSQYITIDEKIIEKAYDWLKQQQKIDGSWVEFNTIHQYGLYTLHNDESTLTAYTLIAFLEDKNVAKKYKTVIEKGITYLSSKYYDLSSNYALAMAAYALQLANHDSREIALDRLLEFSKTSHDRLLRWWDSGPTSDETSGYALLTYIEMNSYVDPKPIMNWLVSKQHYGGFYENTQSTFVAFKALAEYAKKLSTSRNNYDVTVVYEKNRNATIHIDPQTSLTRQEITIPQNVRVIDVIINGTGTGIFQLEYSYFSNILNLKPRFNVKVETLTTSADNYLPLTVCAKFLPREKYEETALVLMEITFPSGYIALDDSVEELETSEIIKKVATKYGETTLQLYFDSLPLHYECLNVTGFRQSDVLQQIPGTVRVYDFYDNSRVAIAYFDGKPIQICDICENECPSECSN